MAKIIIQENDSGNKRYDIMGLSDEQMAVIRMALFHAWVHASKPDKTFNDKERENIMKMSHDFTTEMYVHPIKL